MLKFTGVETGLVCDQDMYEMMDAGLRGGMTQTTWKKVAANNTYMETDYDKIKKSVVTTIFLDANDLNGLSMIQNYCIETQNGMMN